METWHSYLQFYEGCTYTLHPDQSPQINSPLPNSNCSSLFLSEQKLGTTLNSTNGRFSKIVLQRPPLLSVNLRNNSQVQPQHVWLTYVLWVFNPKIAKVLLFSWKVLADFPCCTVYSTWSTSLLCILPLPSDLPFCTLNVPDLIKCTPDYSLPSQRGDGHIFLYQSQNIIFSDGKIHKNLPGSRRAGNYFSCISPKNGIRDVPGTKSEHSVVHAVRVVQENTLSSKGNGSS